MIRNFKDIRIVGRIIDSQTHDAALCRTGGNNYGKKR